MYRFIAEAPGLFDRAAQFNTVLIPFLATAVIGLAFAICGGVLIQKKSPRVATRFTAVVTIATVASVITISAVQGTGFLRYEAAYNKSVSEWLKTGYGIEVSPDNAAHLVGITESDPARPLVVDVNDVPQTIVIVETSDGHLAVANADLSLLTPIG